MLQDIDDIEIINKAIIYKQFSFTRCVQGKEANLNLKDEKYNQKMCTLFQKRQIINILNTSNICG